jgi:tRNA modification GTPase
MYRADTIVACATPAGRGAIAIVRWSGPDAAAIAARVFRARGAGSFEPWRMRLGTLVAADGRREIDQGLGVFFPGPHSFTGEDTFEAHLHGSPVVVEDVVASVIAAGGRAAQRGEFTRRAVLNGKLDLLQAEAIADLIDAKMAAGAQAAWQQLQGSLSSRLDGLRGELVALLADIEVQVDFTDDELPDPDIGGRMRRLDAVVSGFRSLISGFDASRRQREGLRVVFTGRPNAGKSSLVNRLLGSPRMIVADEPGTTRDAVEEAVDVDGIALVLTDTAGLRELEPASAEGQAVARALQHVRDADLRVLVIDASIEPGEDDRRLWSAAIRADTVIAWNKTDLGVAVPAGIRDGAAAGAAATVELSARSGAGCDALKSALLEVARSRLEADAVGISRVRHRAAVERTVAALERAATLLPREDATELAAAEIRLALAELAALRHPLDNEEVLDAIFSGFCIGK